MNTKENKSKEEEEKEEIESYDILISSIFYSFKFPIEYITDKNCFELKKSIINDLELNTINNTNTNKEELYSIYDYLHDQTIINIDPYFQKYKLKYYEKISRKYTTDITFLEDYQKYFKSNIFIELSDEIENTLPLTISISKIWNEIKYNKYFKETYYYIEWNYLEFMNKSEIYLQIMNTLNLTSPIISLLSPLMIFITPFYMLKTMGVNITLKMYLCTLKHILYNNLNNIRILISKDVSINQKIYIIMSFAYYIYITYSNIMNYLNFNKKMSQIYNYFNIINDFLILMHKQMNKYINYINSDSCTIKSPAHKIFNQQIIDKYNKTIEWSKNIEFIKGKWSILKATELGKVMVEFYKYHYSEEYNEHMLYLMGLSGYFNFMKRINTLYNNNNIACCKFTNDNKTFIHNNYYAPLTKQKNIVKNNIKLRKNLIISGPNASGKTTIMKSVFLNIVLSQQFGVGFYDVKTKITPYEHLHCYLNIPDTSGRDSLFQAEARRCKEIIDELKETKDKKHFIMFDELFSGTNPEEAVKTSLALITYLQKHSNIRFMLTTHYHDICKKTLSLKTIKNKQMEIKRIGKNDDNKKQNNTDTDIIYTYKIKNGISKEKGGFNVLKNMEYPKEIYEFNLQS